MAGNGAGDGGLSGAGHTVEPEDGVCLGLVGGLVSPFVDLAEEIGSRVAVAGHGGTLGLGVEGCTVRDGELVENEGKFGIESMVDFLSKPSDRMFPPLAVY